MLNRIIKFSLDNRLAVLIGAVLIAIGGIYIARQIEVDVFPDLNAPTVVVMTEARGMAAQEVEQLVTRPIEADLNGAAGVRRLRSSSTAGFSVVWVEFDWGQDIYRARQTVTERLSAIAGDLPAGAGVPTMGPQSSILGEIMIIGLTSDSIPQMELRTIADWTIRPRLLSIAGVAQVSVQGGDIREYQILLDPGLMRYHGVSLDDALAALEDMNRNVSAGVISQYGNEYLVRGELSVTDVELLGKAAVVGSEGRTVTLEDIAEIKTGPKLPRIGTASLRGEPAVLLTVTKQYGAGTMDLTENIDRALAELQSSLPAGIKVSTDIFRQSDFIDNSIGNVKRALLEGAFFVAVILLIFLMNLRTTFISLVTIPLALLVTLIVMKIMGVTVNTMSLGGMAIAIGSLVDDAIVDVENVYKRMRENRLKPEWERATPLTVIYEASREVRMPIFNSTLIIIACFVPLFFLSGIEGRMLAPLGIAFVVSLLASTFIALMFTPVLCSYFLVSRRGNDRSYDESRVARKLKEIYGKMLEWSFSHRKILFWVTGLLVFAAIIVASGFGRTFLPPFNEGSLTINVNTMPGVSLAESDAIGRRAEMLLLSVPEIKTVARKTGRAELDEHALGVNTSEIEAPFELDKRSREEMIAQVREKLSELPGVNVEIGQPISHRIDAMLSGTRANIAIKIFGPDLDRLYEIGNRIKEAVSGLEGIADLNVEQQVASPQLKITPRREIMARYGITIPSFSRAVSTLLDGEVVSQVNEDNKTFDLTAMVRGREEMTAQGLEDLAIDGREGSIPLSYIADISSSLGPNSISRENAQRKIVVSANVTGGDLSGAVKAIQQRIAAGVDLPENYHIEYGGQFESERAASRNLLLMSLISLTVIFLLLYNQFRSASQSMAILLNLPLALIGGVFMIFFAGGVLSIPAIIGFISLFGIAIRNGMLLVSRYNDLIAEGKPIGDAVRGGSLDRLNPILMTALCSALALIPLAAGGHLPGNEIQSPMAMVILGGLLTSTLFNGFIVPAVYLMINKK